MHAQNDVIQIKLMSEQKAFESTSHRIARWTEMLDNVSNHRPWSWFFHSSFLTLLHILTAHFCFFFVFFWWRISMRTREKYRQRTVKQWICTISLPFWRERKKKNITRISNIHIVMNAMWNTRIACEFAHFTELFFLPFHRHFAHFTKFLFGISSSS